MGKDQSKKLVSGMERLILSGIASVDHEESKEEEPWSNITSYNPE
jgi:hypothetical protein